MPDPAHQQFVDTSISSPQITTSQHKNVARSVHTQQQCQPKPWAGGELEPLVSRIHEEWEAAKESGGDDKALKGMNKTNKILSPVKQVLEGTLASKPAGWLFLMVKGWVMSLAMDEDGCLLLQAAVDYLNEEELTLLLAEMSGHVIEAIQDNHANYVLQVFIVAVHDKCQFIINEIEAAGVLWCAKQNHGCRVVQRLLENCSLAQLAGMKQTILANAVEMKKHRYSQHVVKCLKARKGT